MPPTLFQSPGEALHLNTAAAIIATVRDNYCTAMGVKAG
jgi:hypothetical protein